MKFPFALLPVAAMLVCSFAASTFAQNLEPVQVGGDAEFDACASQGQIARLDPKGDNFLSVRSGPHSKRQELDRLREGTSVIICEKRGRWLGIVYPAPGTTTDCGLSSPRTKRSPYTGPCRSGWVFDRFVDVVAG